MNDPRTVIGPLARTVADLAQALAVMQGVDGVDASVVPVPLGDWRTLDLRPLRVAFYTEHEDATPDPVCQETTLAVATGYIVGMLAVLEQM
jgi:amidase